jgi:signal peptidase I
MGTLKNYFTLRKCTHLLRHNFRLYKNKKKKLSEQEVLSVEFQLRNLQEAILRKNAPSAKEESKKLEKISHKLLKKNPLEKSIHFIIGLAIALCLAILIRQAWFEPYEIPTGSMRPTLKEKDRLFVSKTAFGINIPLSTDHLYFSQDLVKRNGIVTFTGENMDIPNVDTKYFYIFPGKKQYIKRMIGKPGDTLYFYGGLIYGIDKEGKDISSELQLEQLERVDHIPFLQFEGKVSTLSHPVNGVYSPVILRQMNEPIAKLSVSDFNQITGEMLSIPIDKRPSFIQHYSDLWGIKNFAMARLLTKEQMIAFTQESPEGLADTPLYMEIKHHPSLEGLKIRRDARGRMRPSLDLSTSVIPLTESHLKTLFSSLYTVRFVVKQESAYSYGQPESALENPFLPKLAGVPDGVYEFYHGIAYKISFQGLSFPLEPSHPLYQFSPERVQLFYNLGMTFDIRFAPQNRYTPFLPPRYVYFRNGSLYAMGFPLFGTQDPTLMQFLEKEKERQKNSSQQNPYRPFIDEGAPLKENGELDVEFIQNYGLTVPENMYLVLGDNHAVSADSREFGFVPQENLRGAPSWILWPFGPRFGRPNQPPYPFFNFPSVVVWTVAALSIGGALYWQKRRNKLPLL